MLLIGHSGYAAPSDWWTRSADSEWRASVPPDRRPAGEDRRPPAETVDIHTGSGDAYGSPEVHVILRRRRIRVEEPHAGDGRRIRGVPVAP